jgi:hypothetical protein
MERSKRKQILSIIFSILLVFTLATLIVGIVINNGLVILITLILTIIYIEYLSPIGIDRKYYRNQVSSKVRYRIHHCDLEVLTYSSRHKKFEEKNHPMDELYDIDYKQSYMRHFIKASLGEEAFVYHEEALFTVKKTPFIETYNGYVIEFELRNPMPKKFTIDHPLLIEKYPSNYVYTNGKMMRVYIPNRRFISQLSKNDDVEEEIKKLSNSIYEIIEFKKEYMNTYKEEQK